MLPHDSLKPFLLIRNARTSAASFPGSKGAFHQMSVQDLFRSGHFSALQSEMEARGFEGLVIDRAGLNAYEQRRLEALMDQSGAAITGGENDRFVFLQPFKWRDTTDVATPGTFLASYGPIGLSLLGVNTAPVFRGGVRGHPSVNVSSSFALRVNRYEDAAMRSVVQIEMMCKETTEVGVRSDGLSSSFSLGPEPQVLNFAVALPDAQNVLEFAFDASSAGIGNACTLSRAGVTFFE